MRFIRLLRLGVAGTAATIAVVTAGNAAATPAAPIAPHHPIGVSAEARHASVAETFGDATYQPGFKSVMAPVAERAAAGSPAQIGRWETASLPLPGLAVHAALVQSSDIQFLLTRGSGNNPDTFAAGQFETYLWNVTRGTIETIPTPHDMFCGVQTHKPDGNVMSIGGTEAYPQPGGAYHGSKYVYQFDLATKSWQPLASTKQGHWYGQAIEDGLGRTNLVSGLDENGSYVTRTELYYPATNTWQQLAGQRSFPSYPGQVLTIKGQLLYTGANVFGSHVVPTGLWTPYNNKYINIPGLPVPASRNQAASTLLYPAQKQVVMTAGGGGPGSTSTTGSVALLNLLAPSPHWVAGPPLAHSKMHLSLVNLPDGTALQTNGGAASNSHPVLDTQIYSPFTGRWTTVAPATIPRLYHSEALLGPDGKVYTFGSNPGGAAPELRVEVYTPPYAVNAAARPTITVDRQQLKYGGVYGLTGVNSAGGWSRFTLIHPGAATHSTNADDRSVDIPVHQISANRLQFTVPKDHNLAPPGWYMLSGVDKRGIPSPAVWIQIT